MILRRKAVSIKEQVVSEEYPPNSAPMVYYVVLTSCDKYGRPEYPTNFFDGAIKRNFKKHDIPVITVDDLLKEFQRVFKNWDGKDDLFPRSRKTNHEKDQ